MIRVFCDLCKQEIEHRKDGERLSRELRNIRVKVLYAVGEVWNAGHVCKSCQIRVVTGGEDFK